MAVLYINAIPERLTLLLSTCFNNVIQPSSLTVEAASSVVEHIMELDFAVIGLEVFLVTANQFELQFIQLSPLNPDDSKEDRLASTQRILNTLLELNSLGLGELFCEMTVADNENTRPLSQKADVVLFGQYRLPWCPSKT